MKYRIVVREKAEADMTEAVKWYEEQSQGLGTEFLRAVETSIAAVCRHPAMYPLVYHSVQRTLLRRFPFALFFIVRDDVISIIACLHGKRHPNKFKSRAKKC